GAAGNLSETQGSRQDGQGVKFLWGQIADYRHVLESRGQVLSQGEGIATSGAQVSQDAQQFLRGFAQAQHQAALGDSRRLLSFDIGEQIEAALIVGPAADLLVKPRHRFHVVIVDFRASFQNAVNGAFIAKEIRRQYFDDGPGSGADGQNTLIKM